MEEYIGKICPFCKTEIREGDPVVVCPECGVYHHEACWVENKGCTTFGCGQQHCEEQYPSPMDVCTNCGAPLSEGQAFCPTCGTPRGGKRKPVCSKCGAELEDGQAFCPKCGQKADLEIDSKVSDAISRFNSNLDETNKKQKKKLFITIGAIVAVVIIAIAAILIAKGTPVKSVELSKTEVTVTEGKTATLVCTVSPDKAKNKIVTWKSSNESVAKVDKSGKVTAVSEGVCTITVTSNNGKSDECKIIVEKAGPDFKALYNKYCKSTWASVGGDGSYLSIDTNPYDKDDSGLAYPDAYTAIKSVNKALGLPDSLIEDMGNTTGAMGKQSEEFSSVGVKVSWSYHPDKGLEVTYKLISK